MFVTSKRASERLLSPFAVRGKGGDKAPKGLPVSPLVVGPAPVRIHIPDTPQPAGDEEEDVGRHKPRPRDT